MTREQLLIWAAGFFDGEGHVATPYHAHVGMSVVQVDRRPIEIFRELFGGTIYYHDGPKYRRGTRKPAYRFSLSGQPAVAALRELLPYLIHKREVAALGIELGATIQTARWSRARLSDEERERRRGLAIQIRAINQRGSMFTD